MKLFYSFLFTLCCLAVFHSGEAQLVPSIQGGLSQGGLQSSVGGVVTALETGLTDFPLPPQEKIVDVPELGKVTISVFQMKIDSLKVSSYTSPIVKGEGFTLNINNADLSISFDWKWRENRLPHLSADGTGTGGSAATISATVALSVAKSRPDAVVKKLHISLSDFNFHLEGSWTDWFLNVFVDAFGWLIKDVVQRELNKKVPDLLNEALQASLAKIPTSIPLNSDLELYIPTYTFTATADMLSYGFQGLFSEPNQPTSQSPYKPVAMPVELYPLYGAEFFIGEYVFNTLWWTLAQQNLLDFVIYDSDLPPSDQGLLNTEAWKVLVPALYRAYPNTPMAANFTTSGAPFSNFSATDVASTTIPGLLGFNVLPTGGSMTNAFVLSAQIILALNVTASSASPPAILIDIPDFEINISLYSSNIGQFSVLPLKSLIKSVLSVAIPVLNKKLAPGIPLPPGISHAEILWGNGYFMVGGAVAETRV